MTTPPPLHPAPMTPERWRAVDAILQAALACEPVRRDAVVAAACGADEALRIEVASLLAAHVDSDDSFLEQPAAVAHLPTDLAERPLHVAPFVDSAVPRAVATRPDAWSPIAAEPASHAAAHGRTVSARATLWVAAVMLVVGVIGGLVLARSSFVQRWTDGASATVRPAGDAGIIVPPSAVEGVSLAVVNRAGQLVRAIPANRPWTPRFSPDGHRVAYGAFGAGRESSDLWVTDLDAGTTRRLTDGDADANDPQWSADGASIAYSASAPGGKDVMVSPLSGAVPHVLTSRPGTQFPSDWLRDGSALLVTEEAGDSHDILVPPYFSSLLASHGAGE